MKTIKIIKNVFKNGYQQIQFAFVLIKIINPKNQDTKNILKQLIK